MRIVANQDKVQELLNHLQTRGHDASGWLTRLVDPATGEHWCHTYLGSSYHGGGLPILYRDPTPTPAELLELMASSADPAEIAASAWMLVEADDDGAHKERLLSAAEEAIKAGEPQRAAIIIGWGLLLEESNLRSALGKEPSEVTADHDHFRAIAVRARSLLQLAATDPPLRDLAVFGIDEQPGVG